MVCMKKVGRPKKQYPTAKSISELKKTLLAEGVCVLAGVGLFKLKKLKSRKFPDRWDGKIIKTTSRVCVRFLANEKFSVHFQSWSSKQPIK